MGHHGGPYININNFMMKNRYILLSDSEPLSEHQSINDIAKAIGCTRAHIYKYIKDYHFTYKKKNYQIIDKVYEYMSNHHYQQLIKQNEK